MFTKVTHGERCTCHLCHPMEGLSDDTLRGFMRYEGAFGRGVRAHQELQRRQAAGIRRLSSPAMVQGSEVSYR